MLQFRLQKTSSWSATRIKVGDPMACRSWLTKATPTSPIHSAAARPSSMCAIRAIRSPSVSCRSIRARGRFTCRPLVICCSWSRNSIFIASIFERASTTASPLRMCAVQCSGSGAQIIQPGYVYTTSRSRQALSRLAFWRSKALGCIVSGGLENATPMPRRSWTALPIMF
jgi:hypothetical protein